MQARLLIATLSTLLAAMTLPSIAQDTGRQLGSTSSSSASLCTSYFAGETVQCMYVDQKAGGSMLVHKVQPVYPAAARQARVQGTVELKALIDKHGKIEKLVAVSGHPLLIPAAMDAVKKWKYKPYSYEGQKVEVETTIIVNFELDSD
jgi:TonB family protein